MNTLLLWPLLILQLTFPGSEVLDLLESGKLVFTENTAEVPSGLKQQLGQSTNTPFILEDDWTNSKGGSSGTSSRVLIFYAYDPASRDCLLYYEKKGPQSAYILVYGKFRKPNGDYSLQAVQFSAALTKGDKSVNGLIDRLQKEAYMVSESF
jgi:hypothetical protein